MPHADVVAEGYNPVCGDEVEMQLDVRRRARSPASACIGRGCSISQASGSMMSELVEGKSIGEIRRLTDEFKHMLTDPEAPVPEDLGDLEALQGVGKFAVRVKCATLAWHTLADGIAQHEKRRRRSQARGGSRLMAIPVRRLNHAVLYVRDLDRSVDFYHRAFGFEEIAREGGMMAFLRAAGRRTTTISG